MEEDEWLTSCPNCGEPLPEEYQRANIQVQEGLRYISCPKCNCMIYVGPKDKQ
jgi:formate dehydrogenase maturation protein FdhE